MLSRILDKAGSLGVLISAMGCAACFPALGSLATSLGLGFLASFEGVLINKILPAFALFALILNTYMWGKNGIHLRGILSVLGPLAVLLTLYPLWKYGWSTYLFYIGIVLMVIMSILEVVKPVKPVCTTTDGKDVNCS